MAKPTIQSIDLGDLVEDQVTKFKGVAVSRHEFINGCTRFAVQSQTLKEDGVPSEAQFFDEPQLTLVKKAVVVVPAHKLRIVQHTPEQVKEAAKAPGGPMPHMPKRNPVCKSR